eukprot:m.44171 g.44171  ORF g.44171 m.44171 type:complete len:312 (-) comp14926_c0_seq1:163-1098(-)
MASQGAGSTTAPTPELTASCSNVFVVTGGGSGLGATTVAALAALSDTRVVFALDRSFRASERKAAPTRDAATGVHAQIYNIVCDVTDDASVKNAREQVTSLHPAGHAGVDGIVHCAGVNYGGPLMEIDTAELERTFGVNVVGIIRVQQAFFPLLRRRRGVTVLISSEVALPRAVTAFAAPYSTSKIAVEGLAVALRQEFQMLDPALHVVVINPGACRTPMLATAIESNFSKHIAAGSVWEAPLRRARDLAEAYMQRNMGPPDAVAAAVVAAVQSPTQSRRVVNRSWEMLLLGWVPQAAVDFAMRWTIGSVP